MIARTSPSGPAVKGRYRKLTPESDPGPPKRTPADLAEPRDLPKEAAGPRGQHRADHCRLNRMVCPNLSPKNRSRPRRVTTRCQQPGAFACRSRFAERRIFNKKKPRPNAIFLCITLGLLHMTTSFFPQNYPQVLPALKKVRLRNLNIVGFLQPGLNGMWLVRGGAVSNSNRHFRLLRGLGYCTGMAPWTGDKGPTCGYPALAWRLR